MIWTIKILHELSAIGSCCFPEGNCSEWQERKTNKSPCVVSFPPPKTPLKAFCLVDYGNGVNMCRILISCLRSQIYLLMCLCPIYLFIRWIFRGLQCTSNHAWLWRYKNEGGRVLFFRSRVSCSHSAFLSAWEPAPNSLLLFLKKVFPPRLE